MNVSIRVDGLTDLNKALRSVDKDLGKEMGQALKKGSEFARDGVRPLLPLRDGDLAKSLRALAKQKVAEVRLGNARAPYAGFIEFGGSVGRGHKPRVAYSGAIKREFVEKGRYFWPFVDKRQQHLLDIFLRELDALLRRNGLI